MARARTACDGDLERLTAYDSALGRLVVDYRMRRYCEQRGSVKGVE
jgi:hypothetical protein